MDWKEVWPLPFELACCPQKWYRFLKLHVVSYALPALIAVGQAVFYYRPPKNPIFWIIRRLALGRSLRVLETIQPSRDGITVNAICPGPVRTVMNDRRLAYDAQRRGTSVAELEKTLTPIGRRLEPEEIAPLAVYLASDDARAVTGQSYNICGGLVMS